VKRISGLAALAATMLAACSSTGPTAGISTVLLGPTVNGGGVINAVAYAGYE
jgi:hypothetical protein